MPQKKKTKKKEEKTYQFPSVYRVIAIDPSFRRPGFANIVMQNNNIRSVMLKHVDSKKSTDSKGKILWDIYNELDILCEYHKELPTFYVREAAINSRGGQTEIPLFEVTGCLDMYAYKHQAQFDELYPISIKKQLTGSGKATKEEVAFSLASYVGELEYECDDESDALGVGIAWLIKHKQLTEKLNTESENDVPRDLPF